MTNPARQAAERIAWDYVAEVLRLNPGAGLYPKQLHLMLAFMAGMSRSDADACQLISDLLRERIELEKSLDRSRGSTRDAMVDAGRKELEKGHILAAAMRKVNQLTHERDEAREAARRWNYVRQFATALMNVIGLGWSTGPLTPERIFTPDELDAAIDRRMRSYPGETT